MFAAREYSAVTTFRKSHRAAMANPVGVTKIRRLISDLVVLFRIYMDMTTVAVG